MNVSLSRLPTLVVQLWSGCLGSEVHVAAAAAATTPALTILHEENKQLQVTVEEGQPSRLSMLACLNFNCHGVFFIVMYGHIKISIGGI